MAFDAGSVVAYIKAKAEGIKRGLDEAKKHLDAFEKKAKDIGQSVSDAGKKMTTFVTLPMVAFGAGIFKLGKDFEAEMSKVVGLVGVAREQVNAWGKDILKMAPNVGKFPRELAEALFFVTSAGIRGAEAMDVLEMSAKASASGLGETKTVADLLTSAINAYGTENLNAAQATDILVAAVREGKAEAPELAANMGKVLPIASEMGVSFDQVGAAVAAMTRTGTHAAEAVTNLRGIFMAFLKPAEQSEKALNMMGTSSAELRAQLRDKGLISVLSELKDLTSAYGEEVMAQVFPNVEALAGVMDLMGANAESNIAIFGALQDATGALDHAFSTAAETAEYKWQQSLVQSQTTLISLFDTIKEAALPIMDLFIKHVAGLEEWFKKLTPEQQKTILVIAALVAAIGPLLVFLGFMASGLGAVAGGISSLIALKIALTTKIIPALIVKLKLLWAVMAANPLLTVVAVIAALIAATIHLYDTNEKFRHFMQDVWHAIAMAVMRYVEVMLISLEKLFGWFPGFGDRIKEMRAQISGMIDNQEVKRQTQLFTRATGDMLTHYEDHLHTTLDSAGRDVAEYGKTVEIGMGIASDATKDLTKDTEELQKAQEKARQEIIRETDRLYDALRRALRSHYDSLRREQEQALRAEVDAVRNASNEKIQMYEREYNAKLRALDAETALAIEALNAEIRAIDDLTEQEERDERERAYQARIAELQEQLAKETNAERRLSIEKELQDEILRWEREKLLESRAAQQDALRAEIDEIRKQAADKKEQLRAELDNKKKAEQEMLEATLKRLEAEQERMKQHYEFLLSEANLNAEAQQLIVENNQEEIVRLLETYEQDWRNAGKSFGERLADGLLDAMPSIQAAIAKILALLGLGGGGGTGWGTGSAGMSTTHYAVQTENGWIQGSGVTPINAGGWDSWDQAVIGDLMNQGWTYDSSNTLQPPGGAGGGVVSETGFAAVHGSEERSEVIFNSGQAKKLYDFIRNMKALPDLDIGRFFEKHLLSLGNSFSREQLPPVVFERGALEGLILMDDYGVDRFMSRVVSVARDRGGIR